ncbi:ribonuclease HII [Metabacillus fastidiosus]|uniref:ribonuclease HII n=1 Tax=Metabacillus fastidiosus TaxID=1458 RepID=UPI002DB8888A|nr:ribonuclease HII [Metabacillus fastidiosus]MEC2076997.1 ribonuclease HII [Metabacillus fastidiosus]
MKLSSKEIKMKLESITSINDPFLKECKEDTRKTVQQLVNRWMKQYEKEESDRNLFLTMSEYEGKVRQLGCQFIAGIDEVGRGPLAGPVVSAAVILPEDFYLPGLTDSKKLSEKKREEFFYFINENALAVGIGIISSEVIDEVNIYEATKLAMTEAIKNLSIKPDYLLLDAMELQIPIPQQAIIKGDAKSISIAASSCIAKVTRDRMMQDLAKDYPQYGFDKHMGYGTKAHLEALYKYGPIQQHRKSFAPVKNLV